MNNVIAKKISELLTNIADCAQKDKEIEEFSQRIGDTSRLYLNYKNKGDEKKANAIYKHLKAQCASVSTIESLRNKQEAEKMVWFAIDTALEVGLKFLL